MIAETMDVVICIWLKRDSVLSEKSTQHMPDKRRVEFEENLEAKPALSADYVNTSNRVNRGGMEDILIKHTITQPPVIT